ncbi:hypothetical protein Sjap_003146 [Stephania japonica]|uniref:DNA repair protein RAD16 n=1 Tax=Stephania japonica TaxID=461633 RepID=A0AAP0PWT2_9MAGN
MMTMAMMMMMMMMMCMILVIVADRIIYVCLIPASVNPMVVVIRVRIRRKRRGRRGKWRVRKGREMLLRVLFQMLFREAETGGGGGGGRGRRGRKEEDWPVLLWEIWEEENERWIDDNEDKDVDLDDQDEIAEVAEAPSDLLLPLLRYQREWLAWALKQEDSHCRGGILADEMGMGKTIQAVALVIAKRAIASTGSESGVCLSVPSSSMGLPELKCTLVICPLVAVTQWKNEIAMYTREGSTKVLIYHGANRRKKLSQFSDYDFVLTTYSTVEAEYRKHVMPPKEKCNWCGKHYYHDKMVTHLRYFCGPDAIKTEKQSKQLRKKGKRELKSFHSKSAVEEVDNIKLKKGKINVELDAKKKKKKKKKKQQKKIKESDINSSKEGSANPEQSSLINNSVLHSVKWARIILDEAHYIKDRRSNTTKAILSLKSIYKWALSGTPLQNRVGELYSLVRFLQITPYSYYLCRDCDCKLLDFPSKDCPNCPHKSVKHFCWWNRYVATPIAFHTDTSRGKRAMILLKYKLLKSILLRRTKNGRAADLALPPRIVTLRRDSLDLQEEDYYKALYNQSELDFNAYMEAGTLMNNYAHIFDLLTRLRQAVNHPYLVVYSNANALEPDTSSNNDEPECGICSHPAAEPVSTSCGHIFCKACLLEYSANLGQASCPSCSEQLSVDFTEKFNPRDQKSKPTVKGFRSSSILNKIRLEDFQTSTKIEALREEIRLMVERDCSAKGIVFSQFTSFLDLVRHALQMSGIQCVQLVGSMTMSARDTAIKKFTEDPECRIFLMSLKAGGVALNLTVASHVFVMDPWWNPAVERQAQDRIHRIGQYKPIRIVRFIIENTVEERILRLQEKKELVFEGTVGGSNEAMGKLTAQDLQFLFTHR